ncbi:hypothetical protein BCV72DRAFT_8133, partial [Rhizopus microsporus var. microsporus]
MSTKGLFFQQDKLQDKILSELPKFIPSSSSKNESFRTKEYHISRNDPELYLGDDCDAEYEQMLMNSHFMEWLNKHHPDVLFNRTAASNERLKMILAHFKQEHPHCK